MFQPISDHTPPWKSIKGGTYSQSGLPLLLVCSLACLFARSVVSACLLVVVVSAFCLPSVDKIIYCSCDSFSSLLL